jgi:1-acyl-sn-glycerol-3-phosphate acyltransferase
MWVIKLIITVTWSLFIAILTLITFPFDNKQKISRFVLRNWCRFILFINGVKVNVHGKENVSETEIGRVYTANHSSYLDIFVILAYVPDVPRMIYKEEINKVPVLGWAMMAYKFVPINRENVRSAMESLGKAAENIKNGISYVIYPEGTRTLTGKVNEFKRGMFIMMDKSGAEIIPLSISNTGKLLPVGSYKIKSGTVELVIGKPVLYKKDKSFAEELRRITVENMKK